MLEDLWVALSGGGVNCFDGVTVEAVRLLVGLVVGD